MTLIAGFIVDEAAGLELADGGIFGDSFSGRLVIDAVRELLAKSESTDTPLPLCQFFDRREDMGNGRLRLILDGDSDLCISVISDEGEMAGVEFCTPFSGGGRSPKVREALLDLCRAIREENASNPINNYSGNQA